MEKRQPMTEPVNKPEDMAPETDAEPKTIEATENVEPTPTSGEPEPADAEPAKAEEDAIVLLTRQMAALTELVEQRLTASPPSPPVRGGRDELAAADEFRALYPDTAEADIPDEVWDSVNEGIPLAAAYALWTRREELRRQSAEAINRKNADGWGRAENAPSAEHLSPAEVRAMSPAEVRKNYSRIVESMKHW